VTRVKICGIARFNDLLDAVAEGADALGFVLEPSSPRYVGDHHFDIYFGVLGPYVTSVAVYGRAPATLPNARAIQAIEFSATPPPPQEAVKVVRVRDGMTVDEVLAEAKGAQTLLLDAYSGAEYGGTGKTVNWEIAAQVVGRFVGPVILAGGLTPDNVAEAIQKVRPYAVDVSSGVEVSPGIKDPIKMRDFIQAAKGA
jgi:phosphoribosylanthranilate isomerase